MMITSDTDMGYYLLLTSIKPSLPVFLFAHVPYPQWYSEAQILETVLHKGINVLREFIYPMQIILRENLKYAGCIFLCIYLLSLTWFASYSQIWLS